MFKPDFEGDFPTLGYGVLDWMMENLAEPGSMDYRPFVPTQEQAEFILRFYEVHPVTGRRVIRRGVISRARGWGKSPMLSAMTIAEGLADVRFDGWDAYGKPVGRPWYTEAMPLMVVAAATEDQTINAWLPLLDMLTSDAPIHDNYMGVEPMDSQINLPYGKIMPVSSSTNATKGLPTQFAVLDQTEQWVSRHAHELFTVLKNNTAKNGGAFVEAPNAYIPGQNSVAESSAQAYFAMVEGRSQVVDGLLYDHREAPGNTSMVERESLEYGLRVAYGDSSGHPDGCVIHEPPCEPGWMDLETLIQSMWDADADEIESRADFLNQITQASDAWISSVDWAAREYSVQEPKPTPPIRPGEAVTLGFDGSRGRAKGKPDATALIGTRVHDGHVFQIGIWEAGENRHEWADWQPSIPEIEAAIADSFKRYKVIAFYADPGRDWRSHINKWEAKYASKVPIKASRDHPFEWWMTGGRATMVEKAIEDMESAIMLGDMTHDGSYGLTRHVLHAKRRMSHRKLALAKDSPSSPRKIDAAVAMVLAWEARSKAVAQGYGRPKVSSVPKRIR